MEHKVARHRCGAGPRLLLLAMIVASAAARADDEAQLPSITVTAQKRLEEVTQVPISAMAIDQETLDKEGVKDIADVARLVPGLTLQGSDDVGDMNIAIRGIISTVGAPTTGIYIDDVPVQVRQDSAVWSNPYPKIFDLDRIEVLRGPQGTLSGGGRGRRRALHNARGGPVQGLRRIHRGTGDHRGRCAQLRGRCRLGGPIVEGKVGYRASLWYRDDGGYANRVDPATGAQLATDVNSSASKVLRVNLEDRARRCTDHHPGGLLPGHPRRRQGPLLGVGRDLHDPLCRSRTHTDHFILPTLAVQYDFPERTRTI